MLSEEEKNVIKDFLELREIHSNNSMAVSYLSIYQNAVRKMLSLLDEKQKEIEEKSTIIMVGAEKVKQLEKGNRSLMESRIKWKNRYYKEKAKNKECISKDKIREKLDKYRKKIEKLHSQELWNEPEDSIKDFKYNHYLEAYKEILEEN